MEMEKRTKMYAQDAWCYLSKYWTSETYKKKRKIAQASRLKSNDVAQNRGGSRPFAETQQLLVSVSSRAATHPLEILSDANDIVTDDDDYDYNEMDDSNSYDDDNNIYDDFGEDDGCDDSRGSEDDGCDDSRGSENDDISNSHEDDGSDNNGADMSDN